MKYIEQEYISYALFIAILAVSAHFLGQLLNVINLAPELSDSAFYILNNQRPTEIEIIISGFGVLAKAFFLTENIIHARVISITLIFLSPMVLIYSFMKVSNQFNTILWLNISLVLGIGNLAIYQKLLLDLNYNSLLIPLYYFSLSATFHTLHYLTSEKTESNHKYGIIASSYFSFVGISLAYTKITSLAALSTLILLPVMLISLWHSEMEYFKIAKRFIIVLAGFFIGITVWFTFIWVRVMPPWDIINKFLNGYEALQILDAHSVLFGEKVNKAASIFFREARLIFPYIIVFLHPVVTYLSTIQAKAETITSDSTKLLPALASLIPLILFLSPSFGTFRYYLHIPFINPLILYVAIFQIILVIAASLWCIDDSKKHIRLSILLLIFAPLAMSFGTNNLLTKHMINYLGLQICVIALFAVASIKLRNYFTILALCLAALATQMNIDNGYKKPYRMMGHVRDATHEIRAFGQNFKSTKAIAESYADIENLVATKKYQYAISSSYLFDLSGRAPLVYLLTDFKFPGIVWTLGGYRGSDDYFFHAISNYVTDDALRNSWLLVDRPDEEGERFGISLDKLNERLDDVGLIFPSDYTKIRKFKIGYKKIDADFYAPKHLFTEEDTISRSDE